MQTTMKVARQATIQPSPLRAVVWAVHMALPLLGLWLLVANPGVDVRWENHPAHFWLVLAVAVINVVLGARINEEARHRGDARLFLVSMAFLSSAGFFFLHALATPRVLLPGRNTGFELASPVGLLLAAGFAAASSIELSPERAVRLLRWQGRLRLGLLLAIVAWGAVSLAGLPPLTVALAPGTARRALAVLAAPGVGLYLVAAGRYFQIHRRRPAVLLIGVITAFAVLAEAMVAIALSRAWRLSWWEWHLLMLVGFGFVAYSAHVHYRREGSAAGLFSSISLEETLRDIRKGYADALEELVSAMQRLEETGGTDGIGPLALRLAERFELSEGQASVLERAAEALAGEREQVRRLDLLVAAGGESRVILSEAELLRRSVALIGRAFAHDRLRVGLLVEEALRYAPDLDTHPGGDRDGDGAAPVDEARVRALDSLEPVEVAGGGSTVLVLPLSVKDHPAGTVEVHRARGGFPDRDRSVLRSFASQLSVALENVRLYQQIDVLFRQYMSPNVVTTLLADPTQAELGGAIVRTTVLFADLRGFSTFSERVTPAEVVEMLNENFGAAVPEVLSHGGTVTQFQGDALMAVFNVPARQADHALRAARAALGMQSVIAKAGHDQPDWPRFRVGVNTGPSLVGNVGSAEIRCYTAHGDAVNTAARLEAMAEPGQVVIGGATLAELGDAAIAKPLGKVSVKGKSEPVDAYLLTGLRD